METQKPLLKDEDCEEVDVNLYRSMIGSLMYLTSSRPDIMSAKTVNGEVRLQSLVDGKKISVTEASVRSDLQLDDAEGMYCLPNATIFEELARMGYEKISQRFVQVFLEKQVGDMSNHKRIYVTPSHTKKIFGNMKMVGKGFSGRETPLFPNMIVQAQEEVGEGSENPTDPHHTPTIVQPSKSQPQKKQKQRKPKRKDTENISKHSNDPLLSGEDSLRLKELIELCTNLQNMVLDLENTKTAQAQEITSLKKRVKKQEKKKRSKTYGLKRLYKVGLSVRVESSEDEGLGNPKDAFKHERKIHDIDADEDITLENVHDAKMFDTGDLDGDDVFIEKEVPVKEVRARGGRWRGSHMYEECARNAEEGGGGRTFKDEKERSNQFDQQEAIRLQAKFDEEERLAKEKDEASIALIEEWNDIQVKIEADQLLAERLQAKEQEELTIKERAKLFQQLLEKRRKLFAAKRAEEKRNKPPTKLNKEKAVRQEKKKVQKEQGVVIDAIPLATKPPSIVELKILKEEKKSYYQIIRAGGQSKRYLTFLNILKDFDREDLETMWKLMKDKHGLTRLEEGYERVLWGNLKTMFEPSVEDAVWKMQQMYRLLMKKLDDFEVIMEYFVKISKKARIMELKRRNLKNNVLTFYTPYPSRKIRRLCACSSQETTKNKDLYAVSRRLLYAVSKI
ncbi:hypothetical protein Tco_0198921 [Tanacetum coccineum]